MTYTTLTPATVEPVTLAECKLALRIDGTAQDADLQMLIQAARELAEHDTGTYLAQQTVRLSLVDWEDAIRVRGPVSNTAVSYWNGTAWTGLAGGQSVTYIDGTGWFVAPINSWPSLGDLPGPRVRLDLTVGYAPAFVPACAKRFILAHVAAWLANVEAAGQKLEINPLHAALLDPLRTYA